MIGILLLLTYTILMLLINFKIIQKTLSDGAINMKRIIMIATLCTFVNIFLISAFIFTIAEKSFIKILNLETYENILYTSYNPDDTTDDLILDADEMPADVTLPIEQSLVMSTDQDITEMAKDNAIAIISAGNTLVTEADLEDIKASHPDASEAQLQLLLSQLAAQRLAQLQVVEEEKLLDERDFQEQKIISDSLLNDEYQNPYNILPLDLWYQPQPGAKDLVTGTSCMCPAELNLRDMNYAQYIETQKK